MQLLGHTAGHVVPLGPVGLFRQIHDINNPLQLVLILEEETRSLQAETAVHGVNGRFLR
jgi:hypothetical protein